MATISNAKSISHRLGLTLILFISSISVGNAALITAFSTTGQGGNTGHSITPGGWDVGGSFQTSQSGYLSEIKAGVFGSLSFSLFDTLNDKPNESLTSFTLSSTNSFSLKSKSFTSDIFLNSGETYWLIATGGDGGFQYGKIDTSQKIAKKFGLNTNWNLFTPTALNPNPAFQILIDTAISVPEPSPLLLLASGILGAFGWRNRRLIES